MKPRASESGGIVATAISVVAVMTAAASAATNVAVEEVVVATIAASAVTATGVIRDTVMAMVTDAITGRVTFPSRRKACACRSLPRRRRCISW